MAAIDFPATPADGQMFYAPNGVAYQYSALYTAWLALGGAQSGAYVGVTPPSNPYPGQFWWNSETGVLYIWYNDGNTSQWVPSNPAAQQMQAGILRLFSEALLTVAAPTILVPFPTTAKLVKFVYDVQTANGANDPLIWQATVGGVPNTSGSYHTTRLIGTGSPASTSADTVLSQPYYAASGGFIHRGDVEFTQPSKGIGVGVCGDINTSGTRRAMTLFLESALTGMDGFRLTLNSAGNFLAGSFARCMVVL